MFFPGIFITFRPLPRKHWAAIGCTENGQTITVTVHIVNWGKTQCLINTLLYMNDNWSLDYGIQHSLSPCLI